MPSTLAINPFTHRNPPILYGSLSFERVFEDLPTCVLQIDYILHKDLDRYIQEYAKYGREYTIFGSVFLVESYTVEASQMPTPDGAAILSYTLKINYESCIKSYGESVVVPDINVPINSTATSTVGYSTLVSKTPLHTNGDFQVRLAEFEEYKNIRRYDLLSLASSYCRLYGNYVDYTQGKSILFKSVNSGRLITLASSLVLQISYYDTSRSAPVLLKECYTPPLYENLELYYNSKSTEIPKYTPEPLVTNVVCTSTYSVPPAVYNQSYFNYFGAFVYQVDRYYPTAQGQRRCQVFIGKNLVREIFYENEYPSSLYTTIGDPYAYPVIRSSFASYGTPVTTLLKDLYYIYAPLSYTLPNITIRVYVGDRVETVPLTVVNTHSVTPKYLAAIFGVLLKRERPLKLGLNQNEDRQLLLRDLQKAREDLRKAEIDYQRANADVTSDFEKLLSLRLKVFQAQHEVYKKENELKLIEYQEIRGSSGSLYIIQPYKIRKSDWVSGSIIREKPEIYGIPAPTDSNGYAYYVLTDPNWKPPFYIAEEVTTEYFPYKSFVGSDYLDAVFRKLVYREYLQSKIDFLLRGKEKLFEPKSYLNIRPDYYPEYPVDRTYGTDDYDNLNSEVLDLQYEQKQIDAEKMPDKIILGGFSETTVRRLLSPYKQQEINPITGEVRDTLGDRYEEITSETVVTYQTSGNLQKTTSATVLGRPPEPTYWEQNYVPIDPRLKRENQYIYKITSTDWHIYSYLGDLTYYAKRNQDLPSYPTTAFTKYIQALMTDTAIEEMKSYSVMNLELLGLFYDIIPGDYIKINDIPELAAGDYRVISVSFTIQFNGFTPDNAPLAVCESTKLTLGKYRPKQYTWSKIPLPKQGETQYEVSNF